MSRIELIHEGLTHSVIGAFFEVSRALGFGFLEHVYVASLSRELHDRGHDIALPSAFSVSSAFSA